MQCPAISHLGAGARRGAVPVVEGTAGRREPGVGREGAGRRASGATGVVAIFLRSGYHRRAWDLERIVRNF